MPQDLGGDFGFQVGYEGEPGERWLHVRLPHQCDEWQVACTRNKAEAIERTERFIAEARGALEKLREL